MTVSVRPVPALQVRRDCVLCRRPRWPWLGRELCQECEEQRVARAAAPPSRTIYV
jgi:hypothetical protein